MKVNHQKNDILLNPIFFIWSVLLMEVVDIMNTDTQQRDQGLFVLAWQSRSRRTATTYQSTPQHVMEEMSISPPAIGTLRIP